MSALELSGLILAGEFALVAWGVLFVMMRRQRKLLDDEHSHAGAMMRELETTEEVRRDAIASLFESTYRLEGEELNAKVEEYVEREKAFYNAMLSLYLERDGRKLRDLPEELSKVLTPWAHMTPTGMVHASEIGNLSTEKEAIAAELESTKNTLEQLMDEYMAAFERGHKTPEKESSPPPAEAAAPAAEPTDIDDEPKAALGMDTFDVAVTEEDPFDEVRTGKAPSEQADWEVSGPAPDALADSLDDEQLAREELEGLADLFDSAPGKPVKP